MWILPHRTLIPQTSTCRTRRGVATVELAVVLPVILIIVFGTIEICQRIHLRQSAVIVAYEGARLAARGTVSNTQVVDRCSALLTGRRVRGATVLVTPADVRSATVGTEIQVVVTIPWAGNSVTRMVLPDQGVLTVNSNMLRE